MKDHVNVVGSRRGRGRTSLIGRLIPPFSAIPRLGNAIVSFGSDDVLSGGSVPKLFHVSIIQTASENERLIGVCTAEIGTLEL